MTPPFRQGKRTGHARVKPGWRDAEKRRRAFEGGCRGAGYPRSPSLWPRLAARLRTNVPLAAAEAALGGTSRPDTRGTRRSAIFSPVPDLESAPPARGLRGDGAGVMAGRHGRVAA